MRTRLIDAKQRWAREGRLLVPDPGPPPRLAPRRLPPGQTLTRDRPVLDLGNQPNLSTRDWRLTAGGLVERPLDLDWAAFGRLATVETLSDIHCVTAWSRYDNAWRGVATRTLADVLRPRQAARFVILRCYDSYSTCLPIERFLDADALLATHWDGAPLARAHGAPVRLVLPQLYFWKSAKWLRHLWFTDRDVPGYWEARGYHALGDPWRQQRYR